MARKSPPAALDDDDMTEDAIWRRLRESRAAASGNGSMSGYETAQMLVCLPVPALSLRVLLQQEGWPMSRLAIIVGEPGCGKSSFLYEIIRWHRKERGRGVILDTEWKLAPELLWSILEYDLGAIEYQPCSTMNSWQDALNGWIQEARKLMDGADGGKAFGRRIPLVFGLDSLMAAIDEEEYARLVDEGATSSHFATVARSLADYIPFITKQVAEYPFTLVAINHLKPSRTRQGALVRNLAGGYAPRFMEALEIEMRRRSSQNPEAANRISRMEGGRRVEGLDLQLTVMKNSSAPQSSIDVELLWYIDMENPRRVHLPGLDGKGNREAVVYNQVTWFDWHAASIEVLLPMLRDRSSQGKRLRDLLHVEVDPHRRTAWSRTLGVSERSKVSYRELGAMLENHLEQQPGFADELYPLLGVRRRLLFRGGQDYQEVARLARSISHAQDLSSNRPSELPPGV